MKASTLSLVLGGGAALIVTAGAQSGFLGIVVDTADNPFGLFVVRVYAVFDRPGQDEMIAVAGTADAPMSIDVTGGTFFQSPVGDDQAPQDGLFAAFPTLEYDSYVTIGVKSVGPPNGQPADNTTLPPSWPGFGPSSLASDDSGWVVLPGDPQADPFDPVNSYPGDGRVLLGQFSASSGGISGTMLLQYRSNGVVQTSVASFFDDFPACINDDHCAVDPCEGFAYCEDGLCVNDGPAADCNDNGIHDSCDAPNPCPGNFDGDCDVGINDFLFLLSVWGPCAGFCPADIDGDGEVGITDFLDLLGNWGPCP